MPRPPRPFSEPSRQCISSSGGGRMGWERYHTYCLDSGKTGRFLSEEKCFLRQSFLRVIGCGVRPPFSYSDLAGSPSCLEDLNSPSPSFHTIFLGSLHGFLP